VKHKETTKESDKIEMGSDFGVQSPINQTFTSLQKNSRLK